MDSDAKKPGHVRVTDRKIVWPIKGKNVIMHSCVGNSTPNENLPMTRVLIRVRNRPQRAHLIAPHSL